MAARNRFLWLALATGMAMVPSKAKARPRSLAAMLDPPRPPSKQGRRTSVRAAQSLAPVRSPCGRHVARMERGVVLVDDRPVGQGPVFLVGTFAWRSDGGALAWVERGEAGTRLVVLPELGRNTSPIAWDLPPALSAGDRIGWAGPQRVVLGPELLSPRAVASWD